MIIKNILDTTVNCRCPMHPKARYKNFINLPQTWWSCVSIAVVLERVPLPGTDSMARSWADRAAALYCASIAGSLSLMSYIMCKINQFIIELERHQNVFKIHIHCYTSTSSIKALTSSNDTWSGEVSLFIEASRNSCKADVISWCVLTFWVSGRRAYCDKSKHLL